MPIFLRILKTLEVRFFDTDEGNDVFNIICGIIRFAKKLEGLSNCKKNSIGTQTEMDFFRTLIGRTIAGRMPIMLSKD